MLYITTRNPADSFTAHRALQENTELNGGMLIPMQMPIFTQEDIRQMKNQSFADVVAMILNALFDKQLSGWDVGFAVGRSPIKLAEMNHRMIVAQLWNNHGGAYRFLEENLYEKLIGSGGKEIPQWPKIAIRIAVLFGVCAELRKQGVLAFDVAVPADDFLLPIAVWYAQKMGMPVGMIICCYNENSGIWDLIHRGEFTTSSLNADAISCVERLIFDAYGREETLRYHQICHRHGTYRLSEEQQNLLKNKIFAVVASKNRLESIIKSVFTTSKVALDFSTAASYCALQDYRARTGESKTTLILSDEKAAC